MKARGTLTGCRIAEARGLPFAAAVDTVVDSEPPALIALAVGCAALTATWAANPALGRDAAAR